MLYRSINNYKDPISKKYFTKVIRMEYSETKEKLNNLN